MSDQMSVLEPFIGDWVLEAEFEFPGAPADVRATTSFEWLFDRTFVVQRASIDIPEAPDAQMVIAADAERPGAFVQHYFDSRGVVRLYRMTFDGRRWELTRLEADFSPLDFGQRYVGMFSDDGSTISGQWDIAHTEGEWDRDFRLTYRRV